MAIYTITLANEKSGEKISKKIYLFNRFEKKHKPEFNTILQDLRDLFIKQVTEKNLF